MLPAALDLARVEIVPTGPISGHVAAPASKSVTNRLFVIAALAEGTSRLERPLVSDDTLAMAGGLRALDFDVGFDVAFDDGDRHASATVVGRGGVVGPPTGVVGAGLSGTTLRFLAALSLLAEVPVTLDGGPPLRRRPLDPLLHALEAAGAVTESVGGHPPVVIRGGGLAGGRLTVDAGTSSQFATALLLVAPYARTDMELTVERLGAGGYVSLAAHAMGRHGVQVEHDPGSDLWRVPGNQRYVARDEVVEYDASAAAHLFALACATGGSITVDNAVETVQPDAAMLDVFEALGAEVSVSVDGPVTVGLGPGGLCSADVNLHTMPDQVATVAVLAALAPDTSRLTGLEVVRGHETDRLSTVSLELNRLGGSARVEGDVLIVEGGHLMHGGTVETYEDHRMAMAFSCLGAVVPGVVVIHPACVSKTYPAWWDDIERLGVGLRPAEG